TGPGRGAEGEHARAVEPHGVRALARAAGHAHLVVVNLDAAAGPGHGSPPLSPRLDALHPRHADAIAALRADPAVARELPAGDLVAWIQASRARCAQGREQRFAVVLGDEVVGLCSLGATDDEVDGPVL